ncbi:CHAT domain-containing protein [Isoptericola sp. NPDC057191]|uniref:CHAT domain-containing protein n=1 Tax=Isoptericola sp. NPDC057191 TaxID=3346041 RepID=UPI003634D880
MAGALERARQRYADAHGAEDVGRFVRALELYRALVADLDGVLRDGALLDSERAACASLRVRARLGIARGTYETSGDMGAALALLGETEKFCVDEGLDGEVVAVRGQRGLLLLRSGDIPAARAALDLVAPGPAAEPSFDLGSILVNRGALHLEVGEVAAAARDLRAAADIARAIGNTVLEAAARHNLGYADFLGGNLPAALREMAEASDLGDQPAPVTLLDKARVLAEAGLVSDAVAALEQASELLEGGSAVVLAEVELALARCLMDLRRFDRARESARSAARGFARAGNKAWQARARVVELQAQLGADRFAPRPVARDTLRRRAARAVELAELGRTAGTVGRLTVSYPALLMAAEWSVMAGDLDEARALLTRVPANLESAPLSLRVERSAMTAQVAFARGHRSAGVRAVRHGQRTLAAHRGLGSVEAVAATGLHALRLNFVDVRAALSTGDPAAVFDALERGRATAAGTARLVPPDDPRLADLLERARAEHQAALALGPTATPEGIRAKRGHLTESRRLQGEAREVSWQVEGERRPAEPVSAREVRAALRGAPKDRGEVVVSYSTLDDEVLAVRLDRSGCVLHRLGSRTAMLEQARRARADLTVVSNPLIPPPLRTAAGRSLAQSLARLDDQLVGPLGAEHDLHVVARGQLLTLPWSALPSRIGRRTWVGDRLNLLRAARHPGDGRDGVVVLAGPDTEGGAREAEAVASVWPSASVLLRDAATVGGAVQAFGRARVVHLAAHGTHVQDNAMFSSLRLADGPLFAHELDGVDLAGATVVLSACELGLSTSDVGGEALGFASVILRHGADAVIAAVAPLRDEVAVRVMPSLHAGLRDGLRPGAALARAVADEPEPVPLVCFGPLVL